MHTKAWVLMLVPIVLLFALSGCSFNFTTANLRSLKISRDEEGTKIADTFGPGEKVYAVAEVANNIGKVKVRFRVLYDDVEGKERGALLSGAEKSVDIEGSRPAIFWLTLPASGFANGRYKVEATMLAENGDEKGQRTATFNVQGFNAKTSKEETSNEKSLASDNSNQSDKAGDSSEPNSQSLRSYIGKYPSELLKGEPRLKNRLRIVTGGNYELLMARLQTEMPIEAVEGCLVAVGCMAHSCGSEDAVIVINLKDGKLHCAIRSDKFNGGYKVFSEDKENVPHALYRTMEQY